MSRIICIGTRDEVCHELKSSDDEHVHFESRANLVDGVLSDVVHAVVADLCEAQNYQGDEEPELKDSIADRELFGCIQFTVLHIFRRQCWFAIELRNVVQTVQCLCL